MKQHNRRPLALTCWLILMTLALVAWPESSNAARAYVRLADSNQNWSNGRFFRTGLAASDVGGVQLVPMKVLTSWNTTRSLPYGVSQHSTTTYRSHVFVVGGNSVVNSELVKSDAFFASSLDPQNPGQLKPWIGQTGAPGAATLPALPIKLADTATVVAEVEGKAYLFVLGGQRGEGDSTGNLDDVTTANIYTYEIREDPQGNLVNRSWQLSSRRLPHDPDYDLSGVGRGSGARNLAAASVTIAGEPYIYIFGGLSRTSIGGSYGEEYFSDVYRTRVTPGATPNDPPALGVWEEVGDIRGLYNNVVQDVPLAGAATVTFTDPTDNTTAVYLIGGANSDSQVDANAYIAKIDGNDPNVNLEWLANGNMSNTRVGHDAVQAKGSITVSAGSVNAEAPTQTMARGFIMDDLQLYRPDENAANFDIIEGPFFQARMFHTMETLRDDRTGKDYAYIIGGKVQISSSTLDRANPQVLMGDLDEPPRETDNFVSDGKYYSKVFDFGDGAEYYNLSWTTILEAGQDIDMFYRVGSDPQNMGALITIPYTPQPGKNTYTFAFTPPGTARYFQFIAGLKASPTNRRSSPILDAVSLEVKRVGFPNVRVAESGARFNPNVIDTTTTTITPIVPLINKAFDSAHPALNADWDASGTFFVDIYVTPGQSAPAPELGQAGVAWAEVNKALLPAGMEEPYFIPANSWRLGSCTSNCSSMNWRSVFNNEGVYTVYLMVDSTDRSDPPWSNFGNITESETKGTFGESDNVFGPFTVSVTKFVDMRVFVPLVKNVTSPNAASQAAPVAPRWRVHTIGDSQ
jgi:hypothetical protein